MSKIVSLEILKSLSDATTAVVEKVAPSVVSVSCGMAKGSGVIWNSEGHIVTCSHVVGRHKAVMVGFEEEKSLEARVVGHDPYSDIALLKIEGKTPKPADLGDSETLKTGQYVLALANPFNRKPSATSGIITNAHGAIKGFGGINWENVIVTDAQLNPGYSGGPLVDVFGKAIGLNTAYAWSRGIALPINMVKGIVDGLMHEGKIKRAYLGIEAGTIPLPADVATAAEIDQYSGVLVLSVERNSAARNAGLALGDVIVKFDEKPTATLYDLTRLLTADVIGKYANLTILRGEQVLHLTVTPSTSRAENDE
jgi:S1-C subfamily serine protease